MIGSLLNLNYFEEKVNIYFKIKNLYIYIYVYKISKIQTHFLKIKN